MEMLNCCVLQLNPQLNRSRFSAKGSVADIREVSAFPCSRVNHSAVLHNHCSLFTKPYSSTLAWSFGRGNESQVLLDHHPYNWKAGKNIPFQGASHLCSLRPCQVKNEESEGTLSGESILLKEQTLERELQLAIKEENYAQAAKIRDSLRVLQEDSKASVLAANARFYNSFRNGDLAAMQALWTKSENACVVHPGVSGISGYDLVMGSWEFVWADYEFPLEIEIKDVQVHVRGDVGYVTCVELVKTKGSSWGRQFATNVFERIDGKWFICIHHASHVDL